jgi:anti-sigma B factor antagonist
VDDYGLTVEVRHEPGHTLVTVAGETDIAAVPGLHERLAPLAGNRRSLIVDLHGVTFMDAAGLRVLASAASRAAQRGAAVASVIADASSISAAAAAKSPFAYGDRAP